MILKLIAFLLALMVYVAALNVIASFVEQCAGHVLDWIRRSKRFKRDLTSNTYKERQKSLRTYNEHIKTK